MRLYKGYKKHYQYQILVNLLLLLFLFVILAFVIKNYFKPFFIIIVLLIISNPMYDLIKKIIQKKEIAGALTILLINVLMFCFIFYFGNSIVGLIQSFYINHINELKEWLNTIKVIFNIDLEKFIQNNYQGLTSLTFKSGLAVTGQGIISYVIANITVYFILVDKRIFIKFLNFILPYDVIETIRIKKNNLGEVIKIEIKLVIICMIITIVGFKILNVPSAIFLGVICGILDILPYVGTIIVFIPIIIYNIIMKKYLLVVGLIALYLLLQIIREVLELKFLSSKLDIHPLVVMLSMYIGAEIFGIIGILIGPIYCLIAKDLIYEGTL
ncbi:AI-2E family transporter [uncultured Clostridium sp.]|uniref:AI-2E family transporter n=1 Tax=uncultured Clostridium sp. TaxID=59620 RepID=UPI0025F8260B|nr:AI-2E family transporter [uncultured Clostridium sp.]